MIKDCFRITTALIVLLLSSINLSYAGANCVAAPDTAKLDSLARINEINRHCYTHTIAGSDEFTISTSRLFDKDITAPSEAATVIPLFVPIRFGLSNLFNRFLLYGSVAPITSVYSSGMLLPETFDATRGTDDVFITEFSGISIMPDNSCRYAPRPSTTVAPEASFFWENGVFGENILALRFTRPLSDRLTINAFSNYRHFDAMNYSHDGNGVYNLFQSLTKDTSVLSRTGYNPLTNEYSIGSRMQWIGTKGNALYLGARYADCSDELALNRPLTAEGLLHWRRLDQYRTTFDFGSSGNRIGTVHLDGEGRFEKAALVRKTPDSTNTTILRNDGSDQKLSFAIRAAAPFRNKAEAAIVYRVTDIARKPYTQQDAISAFEQTPELSLTLPCGIASITSSINATGGYTICRVGSLSGYAPSGSISAEAQYRGQRLRLYATSSVPPYDIPYDSALFFPSRLFDRYRIAGCELTLRKSIVSVVLGCQSIEGIDTISVLRAWPEATPPYVQPHLVALAAPSIGPWHGVTLVSRTLISDSKPLVKAHGSLLYTAHPENTREYIDVQLSFDYWSERENGSFAGRYDWNRAIYDVNCEVAVHISSFRFFSKIDNLLNRKFAYVPGYYSPGITFRWGINWYMQR